MLSIMPRFVVQQHRATTMHWDFRLEVDGVLRSWAVPKGPSMDPAVKRLAVPVPDHSLAYGKFEGGPVIIWDRGTYEPLSGSLDEGQFTFTLHGEKLHGGFALRRWKEKAWLLVKKADDEAQRGGEIVAERPESVVSGRAL
jgi:DNA ligase D-like protein (predicted 3'-phosphoesterase)